MDAATNKNLGAVTEIRATRKTLENGNTIRVGVGRVRCTNKTRQEQGFYAADGISSDGS